MTRRSVVTVAFSIVLATGGVALWAGLTVDRNVSGKKLLIRDDVDPVKRKAIYQSKDPAFTTAGMNPVATGASFFLLNTGPGVFQVDNFLLPASGWIDKGNGAFDYKDKAMVNGPVVEAKLKNGGVKVVAKGPGMTFALLGAPATGQGTISAHLVVGNEFFICTVFPGLTGKLKKDDPLKGTYLATDAEAPAGSCNQILD